MLRRRRALILTGVLLVVAATTTVYGWKAWQRRDLDRRVEVALQSLREQGSLDVVKETIQRLTGRREWNSQQRLLQGGLLLRSGDPQAALQEFFFVRDEGRLRVPLHLMVGEALFRQGQLIEAAEVFQVVVREQPDNAEGHRLLATVYHEFGSGKSSLSELEHVIRLLPDHFLAYQLMGSTYAEDFNMYDLAAKKYRQALERQPPEPNRSEIRRELAHCLLRMGEYSAVLEFLNEEMPDGPLKQVIAAEAYWKRGEIDTAQRLVDHLDETSPDDEGVLLLGAVLAIDRGEAQAAVPRLKKLVERNPLNHVARHQLSLAYQSLGDTSASKAESERMLEIRELQMRREKLHKQAMRQPADADAREELADVCQQLGQTTEAVRWRRNAEQARRAVQASLPPP